MALIETEAFVVQLQDLGEADRLAVLVSRSHGRLRAVARGARRSRRRFGGDLDALRKVRITLDFRAQGNLHQLTSCATIEAYPGLRDHVRRFALGSFAAELTHALAPEHGREDGPFGRLDEVLPAVAGAAEVDIPMTVRVALRALQAEGFLPDLRRCGVCDRPLGANAAERFCLDADGVVRCSACGGQSLSAAVARWLPHAADTGLDAAVAPWPGEPAEAAALLGHTLRLVRQVLGRPLCSEPFLTEVLHAA